MVINKNNLSIAIHCGNKPVQNYATDKLYVTENGTLAVEGTYSIAVSALEKEPGDIEGCITKDGAQALLSVGVTNIFPAMLNPVTGKIPPVNTLIEGKPVIFEMCLNANILAKILQSALDFDEKGVIRVQFVGPKSPVHLESRNTETKQKWEAFIMPRLAGIDAHRFEESE